MLLSIITINYNNLKGLEKTFDSVFNQTNQNFEYIVIDGGSTDGSKQLIEENASKINFWISEPDTGIYNAMNKGIKRAKGEYLLFLNSGDWLFNASNLQKFMDNVDGYDIVYGDQYIHYSDGKVLHDTYPDKIVYSKLAYYSGLPHQATLIKRKILQDNGGYDEGCRMVSDWKFFIIAIFKWQCSYKHLPIALSCYSWGGFSSTTANDNLQKEERQRVLKENFPNFWYVGDQMEGYNQLAFTFQHSKYIRLLKFLRLLKRS